MSRPWYQEPGAVPAVVILVAVTVLMLALLRFSLRQPEEPTTPNPAQHPERTRCVPAEQDGHRGWLCPDGMFIRKEKTT